MTRELLFANKKFAGVYTPSGIRKEYSVYKIRKEGIVEELKENKCLAEI